MPRIAESVSDELARRHRAAALTVGGMLLLTVALTALSFSNIDFTLRGGASDPALVTALWISIAIFGLGAVAFRRFRFSALRLQDIAALRGLPALLATLQNTTRLVALIGGTIAVMGFILNILTGEGMLRAALIAIAVLIYAYPRRAAWQRVVAEIERTGRLETQPAKG